MARKFYKKLIPFIFILLCSFISHPLQDSSAQEKDEKTAKDLITQMIQRMRGHVNISRYEMTVQRPAWTRTLKMNVWDDRTKKRVFVRILEPTKERGTSFLRLGYNLWNYLPSIEKVMKIPPSMMLQPWMGSDFTNDDLIKESSYIDDYDHHIRSREMRDGLMILQVDLVPHPHAPVVWGKVIFWVRERDHLPVEQQFLNERGEIIKDLRFWDYKIQDGLLFPSRWEMTPVLKPGQKTTIQVLSVDFDPVPPVPEAVFQEKNLKP